MSSGYSSFLGFTKLAQNSSSLGETFDQNLAKMHYILSKFFFSSKLDLIEFQFPGSSFGNLKDGVFFPFGFEKLAKTHRVFEFG